MRPNLKVRLCIQEDIKDCSIKDIVITALSTEGVVTTEITKEQLIVISLLNLSKQLQCLITAQFIISQKLKHLGRLEFQLA